MKETDINDIYLYKKISDYLEDHYGPGGRFRDGQYEAIEAALKHRRTLVVQKTGWGKSLVYFMCAKYLKEMEKGFVLVVSPLLVLMENQSIAAKSFGLSTCILNSNTRKTRAADLSDIKEGKIDVVFITPETLFSEEIQQAVPEFRIGMFVIDEAHCISDWGHDFRLEYMRLNKVIKALPKNIPLLGTTATATSRVIDDLVQQFGGNVFVSRGSLIRESLVMHLLDLNDPETKYAWLLDNIPKIDGSGIIYCLATRTCEQIAGFLNNNGISARPYHANLNNAMNEETEQLFRNNKIKVIVATIKLGMGYDKDDISFIVHYNIPSNIVAYYQQIGRAGRNIPRADIFLMYGDEDVNIQNYFIETAFPTKEEFEIVTEAIKKVSPNFNKASIVETVNIAAGRLDKTLTFLTNEGYLYKSGSEYRVLNNDFKYNAEHYNMVTEIRRQEQKQMLEIVGIKSCLSRYVVNCLDDDTNQNCGKCSNCIDEDEFKQMPQAESVIKAQEYFKTLKLEILPRKKYPQKMSDGTTKLPFVNEVGLCLSRYGDPGAGALVKEQKFLQKQRFSDELVEQSYTELKTIIAEKQIDYITYIPSNRSDIVEDFAQRLAQRCSISCVDFLETKPDSSEFSQRDMHNSVFQYANAFNKFTINTAKAPLLNGKNILLVDDIVGSKWTLTLGGLWLGLSGANTVVPFALADISGSED